MSDDALVIAVVEETVEEAVGKARTELEASLTSDITERQREHRERVARLIEGHKAEVESTLAGLPDMVEEASKAAALPPLPALIPKDGIDGMDGKAGDPGEGITWRGPWKRGTYDAQDAVEFDGSSYIATERTRIKPPKGPWDLMAQRGADGRTIVRGGMFGGGTSGPGGGSDLTVKDETVNLDTAVTSIDFAGAGVTATNVGHAVTVTIPGGGGSALTVKDESTDLDNAVTSIDFIGTVVEAANVGHAITVTIDANLNNVLAAGNDANGQDIVNLDEAKGVIGDVGWSPPRLDFMGTAGVRLDGGDADAGFFSALIDAGAGTDAAHGRASVRTGNSTGTDGQVATAQGDGTFLWEDAGAGATNVYVQDSDPGAVGAGKLWVDTTTPGPPWVILIRNATDDDWDTYAPPLATVLAAGSDAGNQTITNLAGVVSGSILSLQGADSGDAGGARVILNPAPSAIDGGALELRPGAADGGAPGALKIRDSAQSTGTDGQVLTAQGDDTALWEDATGGGGSGLPFTDTFTGDGVEDTFTLSIDPDFAIVVVAGSTYGPDDYTITGTSLVFTNPPTTDTDGIFVYGWVGAGPGASAADPGDIADPTSATAEDVALKLNTLMANMRTAGMLV